MILINLPLSILKMMEHTSQNFEDLHDAKCVLNNNSDFRKFCVPNFLICSQHSSLGFLNRFVTYYLVLIFASIEGETTISHNAIGLADESLLQV